MTTTPKAPEPKQPAKSAAKGKQLATAVNVEGQWYQPGDDVPAEVAKQITNESAWVQADSGDAESPDSE